MIVTIRGTWEQTTNGLYKKEKATIEWICQLYMNDLSEQKRTCKNDAVYVGREWIINNSHSLKSLTYQLLMR